ncbi:DUF4190 domain-containing protein [Mycolicibacterium sp. HK-90]|uniref:DUF4190 domain-containing protein n=1 Tax=Mycolicibacterium sp. HK-90 TaxID=3056937 RepID=UPI002659FE8D|nr:DUF4190 domain-containing protein [Mycolicibacterium sp. HK-90]WKG02039.1 DUF4190 domain-containing protein [Mycolicibacterium sp. HK-90]
MTNAEGNADQTPPSGPGSQPWEPSSGGYEAPSIEHSQDRPQNEPAQPSYEYGPPNYGINPPYPPALDYPADVPPGYPPQAFPPPFQPGAGYPPMPPGQLPPGYPPGPVGYGPPGYPGGYGMPAPAATNSVAIGSLVASILSLPLTAICAIGLIAAFVGIGLGVTALNQVKQTGQEGRGLAIAGIAIGGLGVLLNGGWLVFFLVALSTP